MVDTGTIPLHNSISSVFMYMDTYKNVGGCCGEIEVMFPVKPDGFLQLAVVACQYVEYKLSHYLDKSMESLFSFNSVLPGAFSMFRWEAI